MARQNKAPTPEQVRNFAQERKPQQAARMEQLRTSDRRPQQAARMEQLRNFTQERQAPQTARRAQPVSIPKPATPVIDQKIRGGGAYKDTGRIETPRPVKPKTTNR